MTSGVLLRCYRLCFLRRCSMSDRIEKAVEKLFFSDHRSGTGENLAHDEKVTSVHIKQNRLAMYSMNDGTFR